MKQIKRVISLVCIVALLFSLTACTTKETADYSDQTIYGQVTEFKNNALTVQLGECSSSNSKKQPSDASNESSDSSQAPPEMSEGNSENNSTPPAKPEDSSDSSNSNQAPPDSPDGNASSNQTPPSMPDGGSNGEGMTTNVSQLRSSFTLGDELATLDLTSDCTVTINDGTDSEDGSVSDIGTNDILKITVGDDNNVSSVEILDDEILGTAATTIDTDGDYSDKSYSSTGDDENALLIDGSNVTLENVKVNKSSGSTSSTENGDFYGVNAALLAANGTQATIKNATVKSSAQNGNGVFSYGKGIVVDISDSTITTTADNSGGIQTTGGGTTNAKNLTIKTSGNSSAAIRSDRGGGTVTVDGGSYTSNGYNSPAIYSTATISAKNARLTANNSEALVIEGKNSITLKDCDVTGSMSDSKDSSSDINVHNVMIYQSMSGDADVGKSKFSMSGGTLTSKNGDMFYITNTKANITLNDVKISNLDKDGYLMKVSGNDASHGWGTAGSNGAQVKFTAKNQDLSGDIVVDKISTLKYTLSKGSTFKGTINIIDNEDGGTAVDKNAVVTIEVGATWTLTGDCTITSLNNKGTISYNGYTITLADGTVLS